MELAEKVLKSAARSFALLHCTSGLATPHSAFLNLIELMRGGFASADSPLVASCHEACLVESGRRCCG
jgi:hypothetical protein